MTTPVIDSKSLLAAIDTAVTAAGVAFDVGRKPADATTRYVIAWPNGGVIENRSMRSRDGWSIVIPTQSYGLSPEAALFAFHAQRRAILGMHGQAFAGKQIHVLTPTDPPPLSRDDDGDKPIWTQYDEWRIRLY